MSKRAIDRLSRLLDAEREALIAGDLDTVVGFIEEKEALVLRFEDVGAMELRALSFKLAQNGRLLAAAQSGVADVVATLKKQRAARTSLSSYDKTGKATQIGSAPSGTERRF